MHRRNFIRSGLLFSASYKLLPAFTGTLQENAFIMTVNGPIPAGEMGFALTHEHVLVDFIGADKIQPNRYNADEAFNKALPYLKDAVTNGCKTIVECTPSYLGRNVQLLQRLSKETGLNIVTNTGYYGAAGEKFIPEHAYIETAEQIAAKWIKEYNEGIDETGIKPGFIKSGVDVYPLSAMQQKLVEAASVTHLATGLTVAIHTGNGDAAMEELHILKSKGIKPEAWIWVHAQNEKNREYHYKVAREGGWLSFDGLNAEYVDAYIQFLTDMKSTGLLNKVLISHDAGWYHVGEKDGGNYRGYSAVFNELLPTLRSKGFTNEDIEQVFVINPLEAFSIGIKKL
jgi:predicted metal-dependent phosphotriesterase family hydrolase